jgi:hypothetical protein
MQYLYTIILALSSLECASRALISQNFLMAPRASRTRKQFKETTSTGDFLSKVLNPDSAIAKAPKEKVGA